MTEDWLNVKWRFVLQPEKVEMMGALVNGENYRRRVINPRRYFLQNFLNRTEASVTREESVTVQKESLTKALGCYREIGLLQLKGSNGQTVNGFFVSGIYIMLYIDTLRRENAATFISLFEFYKDGLGAFFCVLNITEANDDFIIGSSPFSAHRFISVLRFIVRMAMILIIISKENDATEEMRVYGERANKIVSWVHSQGRSLNLFGCCCTR